MPARDCLDEIVASCSWVRSRAQSLALLPALEAGLPTGVESGEERAVSFRLPCGPALLDTAVRAGVEALEAALGQQVIDPAPPDRLATLVAQRAVEASRGALRSASLPGLAVVALGQALLCGGRAVMASLEPALDARARLVRAAFDGRPPQEQAALAGELARRLRQELGRARSLVERREGSAPGIELPEQLLSSGLLLLRRERPSDADGELVAAAVGSGLPAHRVGEVLAHPRQRAANEEEARIHRALLRWELGQALLDRLVLVTWGDGAWSTLTGRLSHDAADQLLVPRGDVSIDAVIVAIPFHPLHRVVQAATGSPCLARRVVLDAWRHLVAQAPRALHQSVAGMGLSAFTDPLEAVEFAERATQALSGPGRLAVAAALDGAVAGGASAGDGASDDGLIEVGAGGRVVAGVCQGAVWGGTDGGAVDLDGPAVSEAIALACAPIGRASLILGDGDDKPGVAGEVRCSGSTWRAALVAASSVGREAVVDRIQRDGGSAVVEGAVRGWWQVRGRRRVFLARPGLCDDLDAAVFVSMEAATLRALLECDGPSSASAAGEAGRAEETAVAAGAPPESERSVMAPMAGFEPVLPPDVQGEADRALEDGLAETLADLDVPAWDATGFSLPRFSQEISRQDLFEQGSGDTDPGYVLEVDDDYGFDEVDSDHLPEDTATEIDPTAHADPRAQALRPVFADPEPPPPGGGRLAADHLDVFVLTDTSDASAVVSGDRWLTEEPAWELAGKGPDFDGACGGRPAQGEAVELISLDEDEVVESGSTGAAGADGDAAAVDQAAGSCHPRSSTVDSDGLGSVGSDATGSGWSGDSTPGPGEVDDGGGTIVLPTDALPVGSGAPGDVRRPRSAITSADIAALLSGYVVVCDGAGCYTFGLRDGGALRDAHSYETGGDGDAAYRAFVQAKVAEGFIPRLDLWSPLPTDVHPADLDRALLLQAWQATLTS